jgi:hypothetical protein
VTTKVLDLRTLTKAANWRAAKRWSLDSCHQPSASPIITINHITSRIVNRNIVPPYTFEQSFNGQSMLPPINGVEQI